jgi:hypothetical protein
MTRPTTVAGVLERLREIGLALPADDGAAVFNAMYLEVTERIAAQLGQQVFFEDPAFMADLDVRFAGLWLQAYDAAVAGGKVPKPWAPLFEERSTTGVWPIQFALAGMNAHIEHDLPLSVVQTCEARGLDATDPAVRRDYDRVNDVLATVESAIRRSFLTEVGRRVDDEVGPLVHLVGAWNIDKARDLAWVAVEVLWATRRLEALSGRYLATLAGSVGLASRCLLTPVLPAR